MGREVRRVPVDFDWPLEKVWKGFQMPSDLIPPQCIACDGGGYNPETAVIAQDWYDNEGCCVVHQLPEVFLKIMTESPTAMEHFTNELLKRMRREGGRWCYVYGMNPQGQLVTRPPWKIIGECRKWMHQLTQDEVDALVEGERLVDFTHTWEKGEGWKIKDPPYHPTAEEVNEWSEHGMGHDAINRCICVEARAKRLGVWGHCPTCNGHGVVYRDKEREEQYKNWQGTPPPTGEAYQIWETVSSGSPISPPFLKPEDLAQWMAGKRWGADNGTDYETWLKFILGPGWAPSGMVANGQFVNGVEAVTQIERSKNDEGEDEKV